MALTVFPPAFKDLCILSTAYIYFIVHHYPHFTEEAAEAHRDEVTHSVSHSMLVTEP